MKSLKTMMIRNYSISETLPSYIGDMKALKYFLPLIPQTGLVSCPLELNKLLIIVVVLSMALTPLLNKVGRKAAVIIDEKSEVKEKGTEMVNFDATELAVILGFGQMSQVLTNFLSKPLVFGLDGDNIGWPYVAFDLNPGVVKGVEMQLGLALECEKATLSVKRRFACKKSVIWHREIIFEYAQYIQKLGEFLLELLSKALGLNHDHLKEMDCAKGVAQTIHYYAPCPEPHLTLGVSKHSDPDFFTVLLQDHIGGLQVLYENQ